MSRIRVRAFGPRRPWARPGARVAVVADVVAPDDPMLARIRVTLLDLDREVGSATREVRLTAEPQETEFELALPDASRHGYGLRLEVAAGAAVASATSAVEALEGWWQSPRHAAITDYRDPSEAAATMQGLAGWHVTVLQHYDWMWRHYRYRPPGGAAVFDDTLGRTVSHHALRATVAEGRRLGVASLAYGAVYGAEPEHVERHPDDRVFDADGEPLSLGGAFYINDVRPGSAWRRRLLEEYRGTLEEFGFDGIHMDTYGPPHTAIAADGERLEFGELYPGLIEEAATLVARTSPGARVLFNCVEGFPLESVAPAPTAALYLELWPPDDSFADVVRWIDRARALADGRQVVIAAYAATLKDPVAEKERAEAFEAVPLLGCVISAGGGYHHTLAEADRLLVEGYYPAAVPMSSSEADTLRALWRFGARYVHLLSDARLAPVEPAGVSLTDVDGAAVPWTRDPKAGLVWLRAMADPDGQRVLHLIDLRAQTDASWTTPKLVTPRTHGLRLRWRGVDSATAMSPWTAQGDPSMLVDPDSETKLPDFKRWLVVAST